MGLRNFYPFLEYAYGKKIEKVNGCDLEDFIKIKAAEI